MLGGRIIPNGSVDFHDLTEDLAQALDTLEQLKRKASRLPVGNPVPGADDLQLLWQPCGPVSPEFSLSFGH